MKRGALVTILFFCVLPQGASATEEHLTDQQQSGRRLFETSCGVCHTRPTLVSGMYGPELSRDSAGGQAGVMQTIITDGTPRMPGFKYTYDADQIAAIAAYLKTMPPGTQDIPTARTPPRPATQPSNNP
jgi:mono/diheme cytochrome c family protein